MMTKLAVLGAVVLFLSSTAVTAFAAREDRDDITAISSQAVPPQYSPAPAQQSAVADWDVNQYSPRDR